MIVFQVSWNFDSVKEILKIDVYIYFNEESDYSEENTHASATELLHTVLE